LRQAKFGHGWFLPGASVLRAGIGIMTNASHFGCGKMIQSMIRKSGDRFSLQTRSVCAEIMLNQRDEIMMRNRIMI
jgi:hypothetical protein